jgi:hypothetical protein
VLKTKQHNDVDGHNATITPAPVILFRGETQTGERAALVRTVLGSKLVRVRKFTPEYLIPGTTEHKWMESATTESDRATLKAISLLRYAHNAPDSDTTSKALRDAAQILLPDHPARSEYVTSKLYASLLTRGMNGAKVTMWTSPAGATVPAIMCPNMRVALFVAAAFRAMAACANCQKLFALDAERLDGSASEKYCTASCGQRFRQKMYRLRTKQTAQSKSRRKGNRS